MPKNKEESKVAVKTVTKKIATPKKKSIAVAKVLVKKAVPVVVAVAEQVQAKSIIHRAVVDDTIIIPAVAQPGEEVIKASVTTPSVPLVNRAMPTLIQRPAAAVTTPVVAPVTRPVVAKVAPAVAVAPAERPVVQTGDITKLVQSSEMMAEFKEFFAQQAQATDEMRRMMIDIHKYNDHQRKLVRRRVGFFVSLGVFFLIAAIIFFPTIKKALSEYNMVLSLGGGGVHKNTYQTIFSQ